MVPVREGAFPAKRRRCPGEKPRDRRLRLEPLEPRRLLSGGPELGIPPPKNVILMIGDGMGAAHVDAARMFLGGDVILDHFPHQAEMTTFSASSPITDSAASATAMATGQKVDNIVISTAIPGDGLQLTTSLERLKALGKATGLVTTATITHATPASFGAHTDDRNKTDEIASDLLTQTRPNVLLGGGGEGMTVQDAARAGYTVVEDRHALLAPETGSVTFLCGQFGDGYMPYEHDGPGNLPHLSEMAATALDVLDDDPDGLFLMIEGGRIDHAAHANDVRRNVRETVEFANTVEVVLDWAAERADTLILVTADHETGGLTVTGDNGQGVAPEVTWSTSGHTAANVPVYAWGAGAERVTGVLDNTDVFRLTTTGSAQPLGPIDLLELDDLDPSAGDLWYRGQSTRQGLLTIEAIFPAAPDGTTLTLYNQGFNELATSSPAGGNQRIDRQTDAGVTYFLKLSGSDRQVDLRLANLVRVSPDGTEVTVYGTDGDDAFEASFASLPHVLGINGVRYDSTLFPSAAAVHFLGQGGSDRAAVTGSDGAEQLTLDPHSGTLNGPDYQLQWDDCSSVTVHGGGGDDEVQLFDSAGDDDFLLKPDYTLVEGDGFRSQTWGFAKVRADAGDGVDVAKLFDSSGNDDYVGKPTYNAVTGPGFELVGWNFEGVHVYATAGGIDVASFYDSVNNDHYVATPTYAALFGDGFYNRAKYFEGVHAYATADGNDLASFYDSPARDDFIATPTYAALYNTNYRHEYTNGFYNRAKFFEGAHAYATAGGSDTARLYDSPGDDVFSAEPTEGALYLPGRYYNRAKYFEGVHAFATAGGHDRAELLDSPGNDKFVATPTYGALFNNAYQEEYTTRFYNRAKFFEEVNARADQGGDDDAYLYDSAAPDFLEADDRWARLSNDTLDFANWVEDFGYVEAISTSQGDTKRVAAAVDFLFYEGDWQVE